MVQVQMVLNWEEFAPETESEGVVIQSKVQMSVEHIKLCPPPELELDGKEYYIHGRISVTDDVDKEPIILFERSRDDAEFIKFGDPLLGFVPISDSEGPECPCPRALDHPDSILFLTFNLSMVRADVDDDDAPEIIIAKFENYGYAAQDDLCEGTRDFHVKGESGFFFIVKYAVLAGTHVRFHLTINKNLQEQGQGEGEGEVSASASASAFGHKRKSPICNSVFGSIEAFQMFAKTKCGISLLLKMSEEPPASAPIGHPIPLDRTIIVAPLAPPSFLYIKLHLFSSHDRALITNDSIPFPIKTIPYSSYPPEFIPYSSYPPQFIIKKQRTYAKDILNGLITVSITFLDPEIS